MSTTVKFAAWQRGAGWRCATVTALLAAGGCAGTSPRPGPQTAVANVGEPAAAAMDSAIAAPAGAPTSAATAAQITRWSSACYREGRHAEAIASLSDWLAAHAPGPSVVLAALAVHHEALGQAAEAAAVLAACPPGDVAAARARTWIDLRGEGFATALDDARLVAAAEPASAPARNNLGIALLYAGRPAEAREEFLAARRLDPELPGAPYNLAIVESVYFFDDEAARRWLAEYRRLDDEDPDGLFEALGGEVAVAVGAGNEGGAPAPEALP